MLFQNQFWAPAAPGILNIDSANNFFLLTVHFKLSSAVIPYLNGH